MAQWVKSNFFPLKFMVQAPVVQRLDNTIHWIRFYLVDMFCYHLSTRERFISWIALSALYTTGPWCKAQYSINWRTAITLSKDQEDKVSKIFLIIHHLINWRKKTSVWKSFALSRLYSEIQHFKLTNQSANTKWQI